ncbi:TIM-barrel domain-containing protein [Synechococcus sp. W70.1]|uniref:TIM-barrel domain-containing protein n=1 Tax=Synechococcus sp. W70.1 TaxID=2964534 RepID=UPI0039C43B31
MHNLYSLLRAHASRKGLQQLDSDQCPFVLTRSGFARIRRWAAVWTGDNQAGSLSSSAPNPLLLLDSN